MADKVEKNMFELRLHERYWDPEISMDILRVPSGWLYSTWDQEKDRALIVTFVPNIIDDELKI